MGCKKAQGFLEQAHVAVGETVDATKTRMGKSDAVALARSKASQVVTGRGAILTTIDLKRDAPDDETLAGYLLGPTGNLKAPTILIGKTMIVGFNEAAYQQYLT
jgi:arsenate reductase-like glutaredoxin family protein